MALLHTIAVGLPIDRHNTAMKAPASAEAAATERLHATFGSQDHLALAFLTRTRGPVAPIERAALQRLAQRLRTETDVAQVSKVLEPRPDFALLQVNVEGEANVEALLDVARMLCPSTMRLLPAGLPVAEAAIAHGVAADRERLVPAIVGVLFVLLLLSYRSVPQAMAALLPALLAILLLGAMRRLLGHYLDPIAVLLDPVLLTIGVAAAVHGIAAFRGLRREGLEAKTAARRARQDLLWPATMATGTTMLGFWSLAFHPIPAVANFGGLAAIGTGLVHVLALTLLPEFLAAFPGPVPLPAIGTRNVGVYAHWLRRRRKPILVAAAALFLVAIDALRHIRVDNDPMAVLPEDAACRTDLDEITDHLGGAEQFDILVDHAATRFGPERLLPFVAAIAATAPAAGPAGPPRAALDGTVMVPLLLAPSGSGSRTDLFDAAEERARALDLPGVHLAGNAVQIARDSERLVYGQLLGMAIALCLLTLALWGALRSFRMAILGMIPNVLPCLLLYGALAMLDRPLGVANAMIGSVMLGLVVDNTIHFLHHYRHANGNSVSRVQHALEHIASPMIGSSLVLAIGFGTGMLGGMESTHEFAALAAATILLALFCDAVLLPALLLLSSGREATA
ncbi:MAG: MMPL family transporter [Planctomycetota bacterium]